MNERKMRPGGGRWLMLKRGVAGLLSLVLLAFLGATFFGGSSGEDLLEVQIILGVGVVLGVAYAARGRLPHWAIELSEGRLTQDNDPSNLSPLVYLPVLLALVLVIILLFMFA